MTTLRRAATAVLAGLLALPLGSALPASAATTPDPGSTEAPLAPGCASPLLTETTSATLLADRPRIALQGSDATRAEVFAEAAAQTDDTAASLRRQARSDSTLWLDECARPLHLEPSVAEADTDRGSTTEAAPTASTAAYPLSQTFALSSRPGAERTIFLDFDGGTLAGTSWNHDYRDPALGYRAVDLDGTPGVFTDRELAGLQRVWASVAEDYAPFDVNVTTADPGPAALAQDHSGDREYGVRVAVTSDHRIGDECRCGGVAYVDTLDSGPEAQRYYTLAWVFADNLGRHPSFIGEAASHEVGHSVGLGHDATIGSSYYEGSDPWAPVMGAGYEQPVTQWSRGEYLGADNTEGDTAVLAAGLGLRADDHDASPAAATPLVPGATGTGVVEQRTDVDTFAFTAAGTTELVVSPAAFRPDLDVRLTVRDEAGRVVAAVDPPAVRVSLDRADGLGATFVDDLAPGRYTATVEGVGTGDPRVPGRYSDYGSLGAYTIDLATHPLRALSLTDVSLPTGTAGTPYAATAGTADGGLAPYTWSATGLPDGLTIDAATGTVSGVPGTKGDFPVTVQVTDAAGQRASQPLLLTVAPDPATTLVLNLPMPTPGVAGSRYAGSLGTVAGGTEPYTWSVSGLPEGLTLAAATGALAGTPAAAGSWPLVVTVTDAAGRSTTSPTVLVVAAPPVEQPEQPEQPADDDRVATEPESPQTIVPLRVTTRPRLDTARRHRAYRAVLRIDGGTPGYTWQRRGRLPRGLRLRLPREGSEHTRAVLRGRPHVRGHYRFRVVVVDESGQRVRRTFRLRVR